MEWVALGQAPERFETATLREIRLVATGVAKRTEAEMHRARILNQEAAHLAAYAYHDPKKMPDLAKAGKGGRAIERRPMSEDEAAAQLRAALLGVKAYQAQRSH